MDTTLVHQQAAGLDMEGCGMNIKELAEQAGANFEHIQWVERDLAPLFERFAELVAAHEREECAKMVDHILKEGGGTYGDAIRTRSKA
jgi:hypothetical protein